ncbi:MAG: late competence development ComFB family protein [Cyanophyceae cyanobacterium]
MSRHSAEIQQTTPNSKAQVYSNVMELLVDEEIAKQRPNYSRSLAQYFNPVEVATYALNRLPPLYASSKEGLERQKRRGRQKFGGDIRNAVRQGFAAIQRDPLRRSTPLTPEKPEPGCDPPEATAMLELAERLSSQDYFWSIKVSMLQQLIEQAATRKITQSEIESVLRSMNDVWNDERYRR